MPQPLAVTAFMASPGRFELPAPRLGGVCSIQLSYGDIFDFSWSRMERSASQDFDDLIIRRRSLYPTELRAHKNLLYFNASCPFCQRRSSANTTNARSERTGRLWEEGDNTKGDRAPACRLAGMSGGLLYRGSDRNGGQRPPSGPRPRLSALDLSAASRRLSGKPCRPGRAGTEWIRTGSQITPRPCPAC